jgi:uncharacterized protein (DUF433 family)
MDRSPRAIGHYSAAEVGRLAGVSARRVGQWARYGIIPSVSSKPRVYSYADAGEAVLVRYLIGLGYKPRDVRTIVEQLRTKYGEWPLASAPLEHDGKLLVIKDSRGVYVSVQRPGHDVIAGTLIDLKAVRAALERGGWVSVDTQRDYIEVDPERLSGRPTIRGRRIATEVVADLAQRAEGREILLDDFGLSEDEIEAAVNYEADVRAAIAV